MSTVDRGHILIINRFGDGQAQYLDYVDHDAFAVSYVSLPSTVAQVPEAAASFEVVATSGQVVNDDDDTAALLAAARRLAARHGRPEGVVALHEGDLDAAARIRVELGVPGDSPDDLVPFRDKLEMYRRAHAAGLAAPETASVSGREVLEDFGRRHGWPLMVKPRAGTASVGATKLAGPGDVATVEPADDLVVQPFVDAPIVHVDGLFDGEHLMFSRVSKYVGSCLDYESGQPLGSFELDDPDVVKPATELAERLLVALTSRETVFHAELFDQGGGVFSLVEIGCRAGGAEVPTLWREIHGIDLFQLVADLQLGLDVTNHVPAAGADSMGDHGGWLLVPARTARPCVVDSVETDVAGSAAFASIPSPGTVIHAGGGYTHAARFRFAASTSHEVEEQVRHTAESVRLHCSTLPPEYLVLLGSGGERYREYSLRSIAKSSRVVLFNRTPTSWQRQFCDSTFYLQPGTDVVEAVRTHVGSLSEHARAVGVMTWDESIVHETARVAETLGLPGMSVEGVANCRDKLRTRTVLADDPAAVRHRLVDDYDGAVSAAEALGYPLVLKARSLAGSAGVALVESAEELPERYASVASATFAGLVNEPGVLVEEYLDGPEMSVDCCVVDGEATVVNVAHKTVGFAPSFEELGHVVRPWRHESWAEAVVDLMRRVHRQLAISSGVTHAEVRLTAGGPKLVELNCRLGGDFIPLLGELATGVDLVECAADIALGRAPRTTPSRDRVAQVTFLYPETDCVTEDVDLSESARVEGIHAAIALARPGHTLRLPPRGFVGRHSALIAVGDSVEETSAALASASALARFRGRPLE